MNNILIAHKNHDIYFNIAQENLRNAEKIYQEILTSNKVIHVGEKYLHINGETEKTSSWLRLKLLKIKKLVLASVIFSALAAEAFINFYAISKGMSYEELEAKDFRFSQYYKTEKMSPEDRQQQNYLPYEQRTDIKEWVAVTKNDGGYNISSTVKKWIEIPKKFTENYIPSGLEGSRIYELDNLFKLRNNLVHHKATIFTLDIESFDLKSAEDKNYVDIENARFAVGLVIKIVKALQYIDSSVDLDWLDYLE